DVHHDFPLDQCDEIAQVALFITVTCKVIMGVSKQACNFLLGLISIMLFLAFRRLDGSLSSSHQNVLRQIPKSFDTALSRFHLTEKTVIYAVCPSCHCTYSPHHADGSTV
ncbi:hypothetical protein BDR06DRAFT_831510, partial [Suillus hirtellus]